MSDHRYALRVLLTVTDEGRMPLLPLDAEAASFDFGIWGHVASVHPAGDPFQVGEDSGAEAPEQALNALYREANIGEVGEWVESYRGRDHSRSLSVGDFVLLDDLTDTVRAFQVMTFGFAELSEEQRQELAALRSTERWYVAAERNSRAA